MRSRNIPAILPLSALTGCLLLVAGGLAEQRLQAGLREQHLRALEAALVWIEEETRAIPFTAAERERLDALADRFGDRLGLRVTLIGADGRVHGDSEVPTGRLDALGDHSQRPEVLEALAEGRGLGARTSQSVGSPLLYLAKRRPRGDGLLRVALDASAQQPEIARLRRDFAGLLAVGLLAASALALRLQRKALRPAQEIGALTASIAAGALDTPIPISLGGEWGRIANGVRSMAERLRSQIGVMTAEKERLQAVLEAMAEGVLVIDAEGRIELANDRAREFLSLPDRVIGLRVIEATRHATLTELLDAVRLRGRSVEGVIETRGPDTETRTLRVAAVPFHAGSAASEANPTASGSVSVLHDVTELARLDRMRRDFVANASHELRTPLTAIRGYTETLLDDPQLPADRRAEYLAVIDRHSRRLGQIVDELLELSQIEDARAPLEFEVLDCSALIERCALDARDRAASRQLQIHCEIAPGLVAETNAAALEQILTNLIDNAIKYTPAGGEIRVRAESVGERLRILVSDTGIGIPESDLPRIFERFYRVDKARTREAGGIGLGLAIVKHLTQALHGSIKVESRLGRGTTFSLGLPRRLDAAEQSPPPAP